MASRVQHTPSRPAGPPRWLLYAVSWLVPGLGHLWLGRREKGLFFLVALPAMFAIGLALDGRLFPFVWSEPLVALAAIGDLCAGAPYLAARLFGLGVGVPPAVTYEYGNAFLITSGLLNTLVILDVHDIALRRK